ncbi:MAG: PDZ domain-containing protein [Acidobacteriota bacterium]
MKAPLACRTLITLVALLGLLLATPVPARAQVDARMFRYPDVSDELITFVYAGDIWVVDKQGGDARRLSSPPGEEQFPRFSPDGSMIAFSGNYDGNTDVYVIPAMGGEPRRITHHPSTDRLIDWTPDGRELIFASNRESGSRRFNQLYRVSARGGLPEKLPLAYGEFGALSPDGRRLAFTPKSREFRTWKRYRGGMAPEIWLFDLETYTARNLSNSDANDSQPMWHGDTLYFVSDRGESQRYNIWAYDLDDDSARQVTDFREFDITWPAIGPAEIVFQAGGRLYLLELASGRPHEVAVEVVTDLATLRPHNERVGDLIQASGISPSGARAVFAARGEIFTVPAEHGVVRNLSHSSGSAERYPAWSPDGARLAYWSDRGGEYQLTVRTADGAGEPETITSLGPGYRYRPFWSPDSKKIAFIDNTQTIQVVDVDSKQISKVDETLWLLHPALAGFEVSWSADSRWIAYSRGLETQQSAIFLFDTETGSRYQVTSGYYSDSAPVFDPDGNYLYYLSNRSLSPIYSDLDATWVYPNTTEIVAATLRDDVPSPLAPRNDEEQVAGEEKETEKADKNQKPTAAGKGAKGKRAAAAGQEQSEQGATEDEGTKPEPVDIDLEGFEERAVVLPPEAGNYGRLRAVSGKLLFHRLPRTGSSSRQRPIAYYDLEERKETPVMENAAGFEVSADGKKLLVHQNDAWGIVELQPGQKIEHRLPTATLEMTVDPKAEWRQIFREVWRTYRDDFYDPGMHGLDWEELRLVYGSLLDDAVTRWDVNFVIGELIGEVNSSHTYVGGGDTEPPRRRQVGLLGIDWALENGAYRVARIVEGAPWDIETRSPFREPGVEVSEGDYILAVNGAPLDTSEDPFAAFEGLAGETVQLTVNDRPTTEGARQVLVKTLASEARLRNLEWIEGNRQRVVQASGGRVGYIFVPDTGFNGQTELVRQFNSQMRKDGLVIDERFNAGGQLPDRFIELMNRQLVNRIAFRHGAVATYPPVTHYGPKAMLINGWAGSGGDAFPYFFRTLQVGPLVGERTWGGLIGPAVGHQLIDGGFYTAPPGRIYGPDGKWFAEGHGVDPDIPVVDDPGAMAKGHDPQLEAAVDEVMRLIRQHPPALPGPPAFERRVPARSGRSR